MKASDIPASFPIAFAADASSPTNIRPIPVTSADPTAASLTLGFPPDTFLPLGSGGTPPDGKDFNGILNQITLWNQWQNAGSPVKYDATFSGDIGGYPAGSLLVAASGNANFWVSTVDDNVTNPDASGAGWAAVSFLGTFTTGDVKLSIASAAPAGWIAVNDGSIGSASSGATFADGSAILLFTVIFNNIVAAWAPLQTSTGAATTRGAFANAAAAWAANCRIFLPKMLGRALAAAGSGSGLTARALGSIDGAETVALTVPQLPAHTHTGGFNPRTGGTPGGTNNIGDSADTGSVGSGQGHPNVQPTTFLNCFIKL